MNDIGTFEMRDEYNYESKRFIVRISDLESYSIGIINNNWLFYLFRGLFATHWSLRCRFRRNQTKRQPSSEMIWIIDI